MVRFYEILLPITHASEKLKDSGNKDTSHAANQLLVSIWCEDFLINLNIAGKLFLIKMNLCKYLHICTAAAVILRQHVIIPKTYLLLSMK